MMDMRVSGGLMCWACVQKKRIDKKDTTRKLNMRTKWGQPVMRHHMDNILKKLQSEK